MFTHGAQLESSIVAAQLTYPLLYQVARSYTPNMHAILYSVLTWILDIVLGGLLEISFHMPLMTSKVLGVYNDKHLCNMLVYK
jgi:hypothetical protein